MSDIETELLEMSAVEKIRYQREIECFPYINRGELWYDRLSDVQRTEFEEWYNAWLNAPETLVVPDKPSWLE